MRAVVDGDDAGGITAAANWRGGGGFRFLRLGEEIFLPSGKINPNIGFGALAGHIWFQQTATPLSLAQTRGPFLGARKGVGYALLFNGIIKDKSANGGNALVRATLARCRESARAAGILRRRATRDLGQQQPPAPHDFARRECRIPANALRNQNEVRTMDLKNYQSRALDSLRDFLRLAAMEAGFDAAYEQTARRKNADGELINPYADAKYRPLVADLPDCPHVCLRIPTGGGKTLLAAHCAPVAAPFCEELTRRSDPAPWWRPVVLWIVPSNRIRVQTADALQNPRHPCRAAMNDGFAGGIEVYDISDCRDIPAAAFAEKLA